MNLHANHPFDFDPSYGLGLEALRAIRPPAATPLFDEFWQGRYANARSVSPQPRLSPSTSTHPHWHVQDITYTSTDGFQIGGWLLLPSRGVIRRGLVVGHGYGGRDAPDFDIPVSETAVLFPCFRGLSRSRRADIASDPTGHVLHGIETPARFILGGCVEDLWVAVSVLIELYPSLDGQVGYSGLSLGGGIGALALPFDERIDRGHLVVPTFGNMPLWLTLPTTGSGHSVQHHARQHPDVLDTLRFFDASVAARRIAKPTLFAVALFDPAVAPPCQFSIANARPKSPTHDTFILDAGHFEYPEREQQLAALADEVRVFFASKSDA